MPWFCRVYHIIASQDITSTSPKINNINTSIPKMYISCLVFSVQVMYMNSCYIFNSFLLKNWNNTLYYWCLYGATGDQVEHTNWVLLMIYMLLQLYFSIKFWKFLFRNLYLNLGLWHMVLFFGYFNFWVFSYYCKGTLFFFYVSYYKTKILWHN